MVLDGTNEKDRRTHTFDHANAVMPTGDSELMQSLVKKVKQLDMRDRQRSGEQESLKINQATTELQQNDPIRSNRNGNIGSHQ